MGKILVEVCLISARGLRVGIGSSLLKHQWYGVGWVDPENKYCTTINTSRSDNPVWRTKFTTLLDESAIQDSNLRVEVYSREPIFLRKRLHGSATISLKEFLTKYKQQSSVIEETGSYQLRKMNSTKSQGFVDVSVRISAERQDFGGFTGDIGGVMLSTNYDYMAGSSQQPLNQSNNVNPFSVPPYNLQMQQPYYPSAMQPPLPPSNAGYMPTTYIPRSENVLNIPSSSSGGAGRGFAKPGTGFAAGIGAGAIAGAGAVAGGVAGAVAGAGAVLYGFELPSSLPHPSVSISIDPPF